MLILEVLTKTFFHIEELQSEVSHQNVVQMMIRVPVY